MKIFFNIPMIGKLAVICISLLAPLAILFYLSINNINGQIQFSQYELYGNAYLHPLIALLEHLPEVTGDSSGRAAVDAAFRDLSKVQSEYGEALQFTAEGLGKRKRDTLRPDRVTAAWQQAGTNPEQLKKVTEMIMGMVGHAGDTSNLILDPDLDSYYLMDLTLLALPQTQDRLAKIIDYGKDAFEQPELTEDHRRQFNTFAALLNQSDFDRIKASTDTAVMEDPNFYGVSPSMQPAITNAFKTYVEQTRPFIQMLEALAQGKQVQVQEFQTVAGKARDASFRYWETVITEQDKLLELRMEALRANRNTIILSTGLCLLLAAFVVLIVAKAISRPLYNLTGIAKDAAEGKMDSRAIIYGKDEIGRLSEAFNTLLDANQKSLKTAQEEKLKADEQAEKANTCALEAEEARKDAEVARLAGQRQAAEQLAAISGRLSQAAEELLMQITHSSENSSLQKKQVSETAGAIEQMTAAILDVARNASDASQQSNEAQEKANAGASVVKEAVDSIEQLKDMTLSLKDKLLRLDTHAKDIGQIMTVINDIADQTNLLALNAAIEAARVGEAGRGFAVVADEVRKLAEKTMQATKQVGDAIVHIQKGTTDSTSTMDQTAELVTEASILAKRSGKTLEEIVNMSESTARQIQAIAAAAEEQSCASEEITRTTDDVNRSAMKTAELLAESSQSMEAFTMLSSDLQRIINDLR